MIELLVRAGCDINAENENMEQPLQRALKQKFLRKRVHWDCVIKLLEQGADVRV